MAGRKKQSADADVVPDVFRQMVKEAKREGPSESLPERPVKRRRPGERTAASDPVRSGQPSSSRPHASDYDGRAGLAQFESAPTPTMQTMERDSDEDVDDDDEDEDIEFEDVDIGKASSSSPTVPRLRDLTLDLSGAKEEGRSRRPVDRRKTVSKAERERRVEVHKTHLLCLLSHLQRRNHWCNDEEVQASLRPLLPDKMVKLLIPAAKLPQFSKSESLKAGIEEARTVFQTRFSITERGLRRALWAEDEEQLRYYQAPDDMETITCKADFLEAAQSLKGSRDVGAQLFCALLRGFGLEARLVCSLQPLAYVAGGPAMPKSREMLSKASLKAGRYRAAMAVYDEKLAKPVTPPVVPGPRRRLGHPNATAYEVPVLDLPPLEPEAPRRTKQVRGESPYPVYWVEVLDVAYQKWQPVDPLVTCTQWRPRVLEPPASDQLNCMTYVVGFEADGSAKDVTRRYAKAYNSKTLKMRVDGQQDAKSRMGQGEVPSGQRWWRKVMQAFKKPVPTDTDEIENNELAAAVAREPMPRNVADFKDHPVYALERHLRRNEVLIPGARVSGTVGAGSKAPVQRIYRRKDVRIAWSRDKWYRLGRIVHADAEPVKILPRRASKKPSIWDDNDDGDALGQGDEDDPEKVGLFGEGALTGVPIFTAEQTDAYEPAAVVDGAVPKNKFGNIDVYVPSMVPRGGAHVVHDRAAEAAYILGVDYAPALTGFQFRGRHGTAVLSGAVVPAHAEEGVRAVIGALTDLEAERERERRTVRALRVWSRMLKGLRIRERIWEKVDPEEKMHDDEQAAAAGAAGGAGGVGAGAGTLENGGKGKGKGKAIALDREDEELDNAPSDVSEEMDVGDDYEGGGGFLVE